jgi:hypothetical protein
VAIKKLDRGVTAIWTVEQRLNMLSVTAIAVLGGTFLLSRAVVVAVPVSGSVGGHFAVQSKNLLLDDSLDSIETHL